MAGKIALNTTLRFGALTYTLADSLQRVKDDAAKLQEKFIEMTVKDGGGYATMAAELGVSVAEAEEVYARLYAILEAPVLNSTAIQQFCARLG